MRSKNEPWVKTSWSLDSRLAAPINLRLWPLTHVQPYDYRLTLEEAQELKQEIQMAIDQYSAIKYHPEHSPLQSVQERLEKLERQIITGPMIRDPQEERLRILEEQVLNLQAALRNLQTKKWKK